VSDSAELSSACMKVVSELPASGKLVGKDRLRQATGLRLKEYEEAVAQLLDMGIVRAGPGRGGSLGLVAARSQHASGGRAALKGPKRPEAHGTKVTVPRPAPAPSTKGGSGLKRNGAPGATRRLAQVGHWRLHDALHGGCRGYRRRPHFSRIDGRRRSGRIIRDGE
jgi:hypothetical protein